MCTPYFVHAFLGVKWPLAAIFDNSVSITMRQFVSLRYPLLCMDSTGQPRYTVVLIRLVYNNVFQQQ